MSRPNFPVTEDALLIGIVSVVWAVLALLYEFVPSFEMPGSALVWGAGAILFSTLAALIIAADWGGRRRREAHH